MTVLPRNCDISFKTYYPELVISALWHQLSRTCDISFMTSAFQNLWYQLYDISFPELVISALWRYYPELVTSALRHTIQNLWQQLYDGTIQNSCKFWSKIFSVHALSNEAFMTQHIIVIIFGTYNCKKIAQIQINTCLMLTPYFHAVALNFLSKIFIQMWRNFQKLIIFTKNLKEIWPTIYESSA